MKLKKNVTLVLAGANVHVQASPRSEAIYCVGSLLPAADGFARGLGGFFGGFSSVESAKEMNEGTK